MRIRYAFEKSRLNVDGAAYQPTVRRTSHSFQPIHTTPEPSEQRKKKFFSSIW